MVTDDKKKKVERDEPIIAPSVIPVQILPEDKPVNTNVSMYTETRSKKPVNDGVISNTGDWRGMNPPVHEAFVEPEVAPFSYSESPFIKMFKGPDKPEHDAAKEARLQRIAKVNALGDFLTQLGTLAGGGYAPVRKYQESKYLTKANAEIDQMQKIFEADKRRYGAEKRHFNNTKVGQKMQDYSSQLSAYQKNKADAIKTARDAYDKNIEAINKQYENKQKHGSDWDIANLRIANDLKRAYISSKGKEDEPFSVTIPGMGLMEFTDSDVIQCGKYMLDAAFSGKSKYMDKLSDETRGLLIAAQANPSLNSYKAALASVATNPELFDAIKPFVSNGRYMNAVHPLSQKSATISSIPSSYGNSFDGGGMSRNKKQESEKKSNQYDYSKMNF